MQVSQLMLTERSCQPQLITNYLLINYELITIIIRVIISMMFPDRECHKLLGVTQSCTHRWKWQAGTQASKVNYILIASCIYFFVLCVSEIMLINGVHKGARSHVQLSLKHYQSYKTVNFSVVSLKGKIFYANVFNFTDNYSDCGNYISVFLKAFSFSVILDIFIWLC